MNHYVNIRIQSEVDSVTSTYRNPVFSLDKNKTGKMVVEENQYKYIATDFCTKNDDSCTEDRR